ncbi:MAG TPA: CIA30 family protein [Oligoflexus sp.]|uniref:CIA30 family protein n=1 Tax=Oligoflexus sp. TaxID=1971216 RepID=UPI002D4884C1|nr:CIA30 family protein [Oligoflexus sp.]HYX37579.1 CIA30 family protein [Oligoflexus sp.]
MKIQMVLCSLLMPSSLLISCSKDDSDDSSSEVPITQQPGPGLQEPTGFVLDDFKTCAPDYKTSVETYWYAFNDTTDGGKSTSQLALGAPLADGGPCSLKWSGQVTIDYEYGYAGIGLDLGGTTLSGYKSIVFKVRGDGAAYRLKLPMKAQLDRNEFNFHGVDMMCGDGSSNWKTVTLDLATLQQEQGWGQPVKLDLADVGKIQIQTKGQPIPAFACEIAALSLMK